MTLACVHNSRLCVNFYCLLFNEQPSLVVVLTITRFNYFIDLECIKLKYLKVAQEWAEWEEFFEAPFQALRFE